MDFIELSKKQRGEVEGKMKDLLETCRQYGVPMFASVAVANDGRHTEYANTVFGARVHDIRLADDQIQRHILIADGFHAVPPRDDVTLDMDGLFGTGAGEGENE